MLATDIYDKLTPIFREVFDDRDLVLTSTMTAHDVEGWDSLSHIRLIVSVEQAFGIRFSTAEVGGLKDVGQFVELIRTNL